ncbi:MAG: GNAT family N-acetyltransferase [Clostridia bacterium]|nr:GNAT family N-acetyltransferase [Clostridia bacterium]
MNLKIRKGVKQDAKGVVEVNTYTWLTTYKGIMPEEVLKNRVKTMEQRIPKVEKSIIEDDNLYVAVDDERVVGIITYGKSRNEKYLDSGEVYSIYVLDEYQGLGLGKKLFLTGINELIDKGYNSMIVDVVDGNKTIHFYEKFGGENVEDRIDEFGTSKITEHIMFFNDLKNIYNTFADML